MVGFVSSQNRVGTAQLGPALDAGSPRGLAFKHFVKCPNSDVKLFIDFLRPIRTRMSLNSYDTIVYD